ncbi:MAG: Fic family protein [Nanoarchaeota archaeon]|jgi:Fic family protein|nr:Fic family protein [Nanoarchaeota archaeon]
MSYLEIKENKDTSYASFTKKISFMGDNLVIKKHIGKNTEHISKEKYILDNLEQISMEEFDFRKRFLIEIKNKISHHPKLPEKVEYNSILINNLIDAKKCRKMINVEFAKEFIFNSNNIEGSKITRREIEKIIETGNSKYKNRNEVREVKNSIKAFNYLIDGFKFNIASIKRLYYILTKNLTMEGGEAYPRGFKEVSNIVNNQTTTLPQNVEKELTLLLDWYKTNRRKEHPIILAFEFHRKYEMIHPFLDVNGRTGRLLMNKILMSGGYSPVVVYKENKLSYFNALSKSSDGNKKKYYQFMLEQADRTYEFVLKTMARY